MIKSSYKKLLDELKRILPNNKLVTYLNLNILQEGKKNERELIEDVFQTAISPEIYESQEGSNDEKIDNIYRIYEENNSFSESKATSKDIHWVDIFQLNSQKEDLRLRKVELENFRAYSACKQNSPELSFPYGIMFTEEKSEPLSAIIYGGNGVGKSSIYSALEYLYRRNIGEARLRNYGYKKDRIDDANKRYMANGAHSPKEIKAKIELANGEKISIFAPISHNINLINNYLKYNFLISEHEIMRYGQIKFEHGGKDSIRMEMANALGLGEIMWFNRLIFKLSIYNEYLPDAHDPENEIRFYRQKIDENDIYLEKLGKILCLRSADFTFTQIIESIEDLFNTPYSIESDISLFLHNLERAKELDRQNTNEITNTIKLLTKYLNKIENEIKLLEKEINGIKGYSDLLGTICEIDEIIIRILKEIQNTGDFQTLKTLDLEDISLDKKKSVIKGVSATTIFLIESNLTDIIDLFENRTRLISELNLSELRFFYSNYQINNIKKILDENRKYFERIEELKKEKGEYIKKNIVECIRKEAYQIHELINEDISNYFNKEMECVKKVVENVVVDFFDKNIEEICWISDSLELELNQERLPIQKEKKYFSFKIEDKKTKAQLSIKKYLNTFRFHLFNTMLNIGISFAIMKRTGMNIPIILDDVFYASDFQNRLRIKKFLESIIKSYDEIFDNKRSLQLIIFTHDEMIFKSLREQIRDLSLNDMFMFYNLLPPKEAEIDHDNKIYNLIYSYNKY